MKCSHLCALNNSLLLVAFLESGEGGYVICYEMEDIEKKLGFGRNSLVCANIITDCAEHHFKMIVAINQPKCHIPEN